MRIQPQRTSREAPGRARNCLPDHGNLQSLGDPKSCQLGPTKHRRSVRGDPLSKAADCRSSLLLKVGRIQSRAVTRSLLRGNAGTVARIRGKRGLRVPYLCSGIPRLTPKDRGLFFQRGNIVKGRRMNNTDLSGPRDPDLDDYKTWKSACRIKKKL